MNNRNRTTTKSASGLILLCFSRSREATSEEAEVAASQINAAAVIFVQPLNRAVAALSIVPLVRIDILQGTKLGGLDM